MDHRLLPRRKLVRINYDETTWGVLLRDPSRLRVPGSDDALLFRRRFRVPFAMFERLVQWTEAWWKDKHNDRDASGRIAPPVRLKVLGVLRMLGRGSCLDDIKELCGASEPTMHAFFEEWCAWFREEIYPRFVHPPMDKDELESAMLAYALVGLNGAFTSTDAVHLRWDKCPAALKTLFTGKASFVLLIMDVN